MAEALAPVSRTASLTFANTGRSRCVSPAFLGLVPPTTLVPAISSIQGPVECSEKVRTIVDSLLCMEPAIDLASGN